MKRLTAEARRCRAELLRRLDTCDLPLDNDPLRHHWDTLKLAMSVWSMSQERATAKGDIAAGRVAANVFWEGTE